MAISILQRDPEAPLQKRVAAIEIEQKTLRAKLLVLESERLQILARVIGMRAAANGH